MYGLNRQGAGLSPEFLCVVSTRSYFTLASVAMKDITVQFRKANFVKTDVLIIFFTGGDKLLNIILISFSEDFGRGEAM